MKNEEIFITENLPKPLTEKEMKYYLPKAKSGDLEAINTIVEHNIGLVCSIVRRKFAQTTYDKKDLVSAGIEGIYDSIRNYDPKKGTRFSSYTARCIINRIIRCTIRRNKQNHNFSKLEDPLPYQNDKTDKIVLIKDTISDGTDFTTIFDDEALYQTVRQKVMELPEPKRTRIIKYFGFDSGEPLTQQELADELGITQKGVSKDIRKTLKSLKEELNKEFDLSLPSEKASDVNSSYHRHQ